MLLNLLKNSLKKIIFNIEPLQYNQSFIKHTLFIVTYFKIMTVCRWLEITFLIVEIRSVMLNGGLFLKLPFKKRS